MNLKNQTILITGIGGFISLRATEIALSQARKVLGLERSEDKAKKAQQLGAEVTVSDHYTIVREPQIQYMSEKINKHLNKQS